MAMGPFEEQVIYVDLQSPAPGKKLPHAIMSRNIKNLVMSGFSILIWLIMGVTSDVGGITK